MDSTTAKIENVCQHGFYHGQGLAPCPFCHPECYAPKSQTNMVMLSADYSYVSKLEKELAAWKEAFSCETPEQALYDIEQENEARAEHAEEVEKEYKRLQEKMERIRDWLKYEANSPAGICAEIDKELQNDSQ